MTIDLKLYPNAILIAGKRKIKTESISDSSVCPYGRNPEKCYACRDECIYEKLKGGLENKGHPYKPGK